MRIRVRQMRSAFFFMHTPRRGNCLLAQTRGGAAGMSRTRLLLPDCLNFIFDKAQDRFARSLLRLEKTDRLVNVRQPVGVGTA